MLVCPKYGFDNIRSQVVPQPVAAVCLRPYVIIIQRDGGKATEHKGIQPVQNSKKKESIPTVYYAAESHQ
ncbi:hypothetical protein EK904_007924 [Melospiza melodia maxima]|nr:hypothetical protein EK904_007924 [Melospiza melodia maxima]